MPKRIKQIVDKLLSYLYSLVPDQLKSKNTFGSANLTKTYGFTVPGFPLTSLLAYIAYRKYCQTDPRLPSLRYRHFLLLGFLVYMSDSELLKMQWKTSSSSSIFG